MEKQTVNIHGREYELVASRLNRFVKENPLYSMDSVMTPNGEGCYFSVTICIYDKDGKVVRKATGHSYERKDSSTINKTSHVENAETSAVGRALAFLGYIGSEIASADEVANAILNQPATPSPIQAKQNGDDLPDDQLGNFVMPWGKFKGMRLSQIADQQTDNGKPVGVEYLIDLTSMKAKTEYAKKVVEIVTRFMSEFGVK